MLVTYTGAFAQEQDKTAFQTLITEAENNMRACNYIALLVNIIKHLKYPIIHHTTFTMPHVQRPF